MKTAMRFLSVASLAFAVAFTFSCSDDSDSDSESLKACMDESDPIFGKICGEGLRSDDKAVIKEMTQDCGKYDGQAVIDKCPGGYVKKCSDSHFMYYYYDAKFETMTCEQIDDLW